MDLNRFACTVYDRVKFKAKKERKEKKATKQNEKRRKKIRKDSDNHLFRATWKHSRLRYRSSDRSRAHRGEVSRANLSRKSHRGRCWSCGIAVARGLKQLKTHRVVNLDFFPSLSRHRRSLQASRSNAFTVNGGSPLSVAWQVERAPIK